VSTFTREHPAARLTPRQRQSITVALVVGIQEGADRLGISRQTLKSHLTDAYRRLGVSSLGEAAYVLWLRPILGELPGGTVRLPSRSDG
jgi:DNA-binding CsgD family transcriptional regulator